MSIIAPDVKWLRYVDDILCIWPSDRNVDDCLQTLNTCVPSTKFTIDTVLNYHLSFSVFFCF